MKRCAATVHWLDLDLDRQCIRPNGHEGLHRDGAWWFDDAGMRVPATVERRDQPETTAAAITRGTDA